MTAINRQALLPYTAQQMYALVDDIKAYPSFLPWCRSSHELERAENTVTASIEIAHSGFNQTFTTTNVNVDSESIQMSLVKGAFKYLNGNWSFQSLGEQGCKVTFNLEFEFSNRIVGMTFGPLFGKLAGGLMDAFTKRAKEVYGG